MSSNTRMYQTDENINIEEKNIVSQTEIMTKMWSSEVTGHPIKLQTHIPNNLWAVTRDILSYDVTGVLT